MYDHWQVFFGGQIKPFETAGIGTTMVCTFSS